jgi:hypothetical protein
MTDTDYLTDLLAALERGEVADARARDLVAEVESHLDESGEDPLETFGPADQFADQLLSRGLDEPGPGADGGFETRTFRATAFDEMAVLSDLGAEGWELIGVRDFGLHARRPHDTGSAHRWDYRRRMSVRRGSILEEMRGEGWSPCGQWSWFHYFKRAL